MTHTLTENTHVLIQWCLVRMSKLGLAFLSHESATRLCRITFLPSCSSTVSFHHNFLPLSRTTFLWDIQKQCMCPEFILWRHLYWDFFFLRSPCIRLFLYQENTQPMTPGFHQNSVSSGPEFPGSSLVSGILLGHDRGIGNGVLKRKKKR